MYNNWRIIDISSVWGGSTENHAPNSKCVPPPQSLLKANSNSAGPTSLHSLPYPVARDITATLLKHLDSIISKVYTFKIFNFVFYLKTKNN